MRKMKTLLAAALVSVMVFSVAACGGQTTTTAGTDEGTNAPTQVGTDAPTDQATDPEATKDPVTLDVVWFSDGKEGESFLRLTEKYREENPHVTFELIEVPYTELDNKLRNMLSANQQPALARMTNLGPFLNQLIDLQDYTEAGDQFPEQFNSGLQFMFDGKMAGAPMEVTANGVIYNKTAFDKAGVEVPQSPDDIWTWAEFETAVKTVMEKGDVRYGLGLDRTSNRLSTLWFEFGGGMLSEDLTKSDFLNPGNKTAIEMLVRLHEEGVMPESVWLGSDNPQEMFRAGQLATHIGGSWQIANYKDQITDFEWGVTYLPIGTQRSTVPGGKWITAFEGTGVEEEAAKFIEWISQPENNAQYCMDNLFLSQTKGNESLDYEYGAEMFEIFSNELTSSEERPGLEWGHQAFTGMINVDMREEMASVLAGNITVDEYLEHMDKLATESLAELNG